MKSGSAQSNVNAEKLKELVIPECDFETQEKVVQLLKDKNGLLAWLGYGLAQPHVEIEGCEDLLSDRVSPHSSTEIHFRSMDSSVQGREKVTHDCDLLLG